MTDKALADHTSAPLTPGGPRPDPTSADPADWTAGRLLSTAARRVERAWNAHLASWDLNHASLPVLLHLLGGARSQRELAALAGVTEQTMSRTIGRLERTALVTRTAHQSDRRRVDVTITADGRAAALQAADLRRADQIFTQSLTPAQLDQLRELLLLIVANDDQRSGGQDG
ncbi:MAG: MarR family transcriptional regulator [Actinobacteria bacterium]|nr:MarR family transcriptional regulator [Actinomycetota bacterium]MCG2802242.1 MarR family transcriptional regulator [Cellulomonas sp.]